ncbi:MAG TPA: efflux transporter outer membrane subunit [Burkholderiales bacterium]|nr:efflux transporter outer membrane subunit [Burkholderiales bacterium]
MLLAGCMVGPDYRRPEVATPAAWRLESAQADQISNVGWWEQFQDPVLPALVREAVASNKDLKIATANVEQAFAQYGITRSALFPQVDASASAARQRASSTAGPVPVPPGRDTFNDFAVDLSLGYEIDVWGRLRRATESARAQLLASEEGRRTVVLTLVSAVANGYIELRGLDRQLDIARRTSQNLGDSAYLQQRRFKEGAVPESDYRQAESQYLAAAAQVPELERQVARQESFISVLLGRNPGPIARGREIEALAFPGVPGSLPAALLERRPDVRQAEQNLIAANADIGVAKAAYFPRISLTAALGFESADLSELVKSRSKTGAIGLGATLPIFNAGRIRNQVAQAEAFQRGALASYEKSILVALQDVEDALVDRAKLGESRETQARNVAALQRFRDLAALRYREGATLYLEVANAEQSLLSAQLAYVATQSRLFQSYANLYKAMGGGWVDRAEELAAK